MPDLETRSGTQSPDARTGVLITGMSGSAAFELITALQRTGEYRVIAVDAAEHAVGYAIADAHYIVPFAVDPAFEGALRRILDHERPEFIVPLVDEEILQVHAIIDQHYAGRVNVVGPTAQFSETVLDKWVANHALEEAGVPVPATWLASDAGGCSYPAIIKPRVGRGSRGLAYLDGPDSLADYLQAASQPADRYVVQEQVRGTEYTVSVVVSPDGHVHAVVPKEVVSKKGITQVGVTRSVPSIEALGRLIQQRLAANGPFNVQLMLTDDGRPIVFEVNPRLSTTTVLTMAAGVDELAIVLRASRGLPVEPQSFIPGLMMLRHYTALYIPETETRTETERGRSDGGRSESVRPDSGRPEAGRPL
jgi:carbamoyl-phosphate synthase large subunit